MALPSLKECKQLRQEKIEQDLLDSEAWEQYSRYVVNTEIMPDLTEKIKNKLIFTSGELKAEIRFDYRHDILSEFCKDSLTNNKKIAYDIIVPTIKFYISCIEDEIPKIFHGSEWIIKDMKISHMFRHPSMFTLDIRLPLYLLVWHKSYIPPPKKTCVLM